ncbi:MAG TPA: lmo0937 family membrane protein [Terriglobales bacterium]|nr:lmo0937 family membrane protein [Terriglobales bacterium]
MIWLMVFVLVLLWVIGFSLHVAGSFIHVLLIVALMLLVANFALGKRTL